MLYVYHLLCVFSAGRRFAELELTILLAKICTLVVASILHCDFIDLACSCVHHWLHSCAELMLQDLL